MPKSGGRRADVPRGTMRLLRVGTALACAVFPASHPGFTGWHGACFAVYAGWHGACLPTFHVEQCGFCGLARRLLGHGRGPTSVRGGLRDPSRSARLARAAPGRSPRHAAFYARRAWHGACVASARPLPRPGLGPGCPARCRSRGRQNALNVCRFVKSLLWISGLKLWISGPFRWKTPVNSVPFWQGARKLSPRRAELSPSY